MKILHNSKKRILKKIIQIPGKGGNIFTRPVIYFRKVIKIIPLIIVVIFVSFVFTLIRVHEIECVNQYGICSNNLKENIEKIKGQPILTAQKNIKMYLNNNFLVKKYSIRFKLPSKLVIDTLERKPKFALINKAEGKSAIVDDEGKVLEVSSLTNLPAVYVNSPLPNPGNDVNSEELFSLKIVSDLYKLYSGSSGELQDSGLIVSVKNTEVVFPREGDRKVLIGSVILILNQLNSPEVSSTIIDKTGDKITIDLRFDNPVIR